jgi:hypothetical protein
MNWHCIRLSRQEYESGEVDILRGSFRAAYLSRNAPRGMALYGAWSENGETYLVYSTPITERYLLPILHAYSAKQEDPPMGRMGLEYICGDDEGDSVLVC